MEGDTVGGTEGGGEAALKPRWALGGSRDVGGSQAGLGLVSLGWTGQCNWECQGHAQ